MNLSHIPNVFVYKPDLQIKKTHYMYNIFSPLHVICVFFHQGMKQNLFPADRQRFEPRTLWLLLLKHLLSNPFYQLYAQATIAQNRRAKFKK